MQPLLATLGTVHFGRMNMKPGKPATFATVESQGRTKLIFALPGNPVSAQVTFYLLVHTAIRKLSGLASPQLPRLQARLAADMRLDPTRPEYHRVALRWEDGSLVAYSTGVQLSSRLLSLRGANGLLELPSGPGSQAKGSVCWVNLIAPLDQLTDPLPVQDDVPAPLNVSCRCGDADTSPSADTSSSSSSSSEGDAPDAKKQKLTDSKATWTLRACVLTASDRCSRGQAVDKSGPACVAFLQAPEHTPEDVRVVVTATALVEDDVDAIQGVIRGWTDAANEDSRPHLIITTGGTGFTPRDVTPEAVKGLLERDAPGLAFLMTHASLQHTPMAALSRAVAGTRGQTLILTLPGNPKAVPEVLAPLLAIVPHACRLMEGQVLQASL
jgi:gephyrin